MNRKIFSLLLFFMYGIRVSSLAQGLEDVIVETYYITNYADAKFAGAGKIAENSVTYRVFIDMNPGYYLQSVYGAPQHEMVIGSSTYFFNHPECGNYIPNLITDKSLSENTTMLDTWIGMGGGSQERFAVLKTDDDTVATVRHIRTPGMLLNNDPKAGIAVFEKDGLVLMPYLPFRVSQVGLDSLLTLFDKNNTPGTGFSFRTTNGGWGCLGGAHGIDTLTNRVCIGQFTTNGDFYFEFNIQIGSPDQRVEQYVARNPTGDEQIFGGLIITRRSLPVNKKDQNGNKINK